MSAAGRKRDPIWNCFDELRSIGKTGSRAKCKDCTKNIL